MRELDHETRVTCGCTVRFTVLVSDSEPRAFQMVGVTMIDFCPLHASAKDMLKTLEIIEAGGASGMARAAIVRMKSLEVAVDGKVPVAHYMPRKDDGKSCRRPKN